MTAVMFVTAVNWLKCTCEAISKGVKHFGINVKTGTAGWHISTAQSKTGNSKTKSVFCEPGSKRSYVRLHEEKCQKKYVLA